VGCKYAVSERERKDKEIGTETVLVAISLYVYHFLGKLGISKNEAVQVAFAVAQVYEPVSISVTGDY
jgi:hypothetical protein